MKNSVHFRFVHVGLVLGAAILLVSAAPAAALDKTVLNNGSSVALNNPSVAVGPDGNIHIAAQGRLLGNLSNRGGTSIYYMLVKPDGTVLIDATPVNTADNRWSIPHIAVTSTGKAVIIWQGGGGHATRYSLVDPSLAAPLNGSAAPAAVAVTEQVVGVNTSSGRLALAVDGNDIAHVARASGGSLWYLSFDPVNGPGTIVTAETAIDNATSSRYSQPAIGVDSSGNVHIAYSSTSINSNGPPAYVMLNGTDGSKLIAPTALVPGPVFPETGFFSLTVGQNDHVHVVYADKPNNGSCGASGGGCNAFAVYTQLDPSKAVQDGTTVNPIATFQVGSVAPIGSYWYGRAYPGSDGLIHFFFGESRGGAGRFSSLALDTAGNIVSAATRSDSQVQGFERASHLVGSAGSVAVWGETAFNATFSANTNQLVMTTTPGYRTPPHQSSGAVAPAVLLIFALGGLWRNRRRVIDLPG